MDLYDDANCVCWDIFDVTTKHLYDSGISCDLYSGHKDIFPHKTTVVFVSDVNPAAADDSPFKHRHTFKEYVNVYGGILTLKTSRTLQIL